MPGSRRTVLRRGLVLGGFGLAGCLAGDGGTPTTTNDEMPTEVRFWLREVPLSESERDAIEPIVYGDLSVEQQSIVQTALEEGEYTSQMGEEPPPLAGLRRAISARTDDGVEAHLEREDTYYRIGFVSGDHIIADPSYEIRRTNR